MGMLNARRVGLLLMLIACAPLIMAAGGGPFEDVNAYGLAFNDLNGNGVHDPGEPGAVRVLIRSYTGRIDLGAPVSATATLTLDRHTRRPATGDPDVVCSSLPGCTTTNGGAGSIILTRGGVEKRTTFSFNGGFKLGCVPGLTASQETSNGGTIEEPPGSGNRHFYIAIQEWLPRAVLVDLFAQLGVSIGQRDQLSIQVNHRACIDDDPNLPYNVGVRNPGVLKVDADIQFRPITFQPRGDVRDQATPSLVSQAPRSNYGVQLFSAREPHTICQLLPDGFIQTLPIPGPGIVQCADAANDEPLPAGFHLAPLGYFLTEEDLGVDPFGGSGFAGIDFGSKCVANDPLVCQARVTGPVVLSAVSLSLGLKNGDDQGTLFDLKADLFKNGGLLASGLRRCVTGLTRNPNKGLNGDVFLDTFGDSDLAASDVLTLKISTRIGTNPDDTKCAPARGSSHSSARGLRLYYDSARQASHIFGFDSLSGEEFALYLVSNGTACPGGGGESARATDRTLTGASPTAAAAKCKDSSAITFSGGNQFKEVGTWTLR
jgi:hypothetical protein